MNLPFRTVLLAQAATAPAFAPQDALKLNYQACFGAEHLLTDPIGAQQYFEQEYQTLDVTPFDHAPVGSEPLFEQISDDFCRIHLRAWQAKQLPPLWLFRLFLESTSATANPHLTTTQPQTKETRLAQFHQNLQCIQTAAEQRLLPFPAQSWQTACARYLKQGVRAIHHSDAYRAAAKPAYRLVDTRYLPLLSLLERLAALQATIADRPSRAAIIAIDGRCGAGKTTLGQTLGTLLQTDVIHMDDFFLPPEKRTPDRLATPGGNVDYERFAAQVIPHLAQSAPFAYQKFSCATMQLAEMQAIGQTQWHIVEGSYSHHPYLQHYADLRVFVTVDPALQMARIRKRNGDAWAEDFRTKWIPMEERYFDAYDTMQQADIILQTE